MLRHAASVLARRAQNLPTAASKGVRGFAEAAAADPHLPPQFSVAGRYANALYVSAAKAGKLDAVTSELGQMSSLLQQSDDFREFVADPTVSQKVKVEGMDSVMSGLGTSDITKNFFALLADNSRLNEVDKILEAFQSIVAQQRGEVHATVTSASDLSSEDVADITASLQGMLKPGQKLTVSQAVDPSILGGLMVDFEDKHIDLSVRSRIQSIEKAIAEAVI